MNSKMNQFAQFALDTGALMSIRGGICGCKAAAPYACEAGGYTPGTVAFNNCMGGIYADCEALVPQCNEP